MYSDNVNTPAVAVVGVVLAVIVFASIVGVQAFYEDLVHVQSEKKYQRSEPLRELLAKQRGQLYGYRWVDAKTKVVAIPIDRAIELTVKDLQPQSDSGKEKQGP